MTNGAKQTNTVDGRCLELSWYLVSQNAAQNTSTVNWSLTGAGDSRVDVNCKDFEVRIDGNVVYSSSQTIPVNRGTVIHSGTVVMEHDIHSGDKTFFAYVDAKIQNTSVSLATSWDLPTIQRSARVSQTIIDRKETAIVVKWDADSIVDYVWYRIGTGQVRQVGAVNSKSGTYTISGLDDGFDYNGLVTIVRRKDTQLTSSSDALDFSTYSWPYANSLPNFPIGRDVTIGIYNPLGRTVKVYLIANGTTLGTTWTTSTTQVTIPSSISNALLQTIPNAASAQYKIKTQVSNSHDRTVDGGAYYVNQIDSAPRADTLTYADTNSETLAVTGDSSIIIQTKSTVTFTATNVRAVDYASLVSCAIKVNNTTYPMTISGTTATVTGISINSASSLTASLLITDSRGIVGRKDVSVTMWSWHMPSAIITLKREANYYDETTLKVDADYSYLGGYNGIDIDYRCRPKDGTWGSYVTIGDGDAVTLTLSNAYAWEFEIRLHDVLSTMVSYTRLLPRGLPLIYFDRVKQSVGIECIPQNSETLEVNGIDILRAVRYLDGDEVDISGASSNSLITAGALTTSATQIYFTLHLPKSLGNLPITLNTLKLNIWHSGGGYCLSSGYVNNGYNVLSDNTITVSTQIRENTVTFVLTKTSGTFNGTTNTPVAVQMNAINFDIGGV